MTNDDQDVDETGDEPGDADDDDGKTQFAIAHQLVAHLQPLLQQVRNTAPAPQSDDTTAALRDGQNTEQEHGDTEQLDKLETVTIEPPQLPSIWPPGPGRMRSSDVAFLIEQIQTSPIVQGGDEPGVTRKRLAQLLPVELSEYSRQLMLWLHLAGVLTPPPVPDELFRNPRALAVVEPEQLAAALAATPVPTNDEARAAMQR